jgi:hypothetical protein
MLDKIICSNRELSMQFSAEQLEKYQTQGYVIVDCPFPAALTQATPKATTFACRRRCPIPIGVP